MTYFMTGIVWIFKEAYKCSLPAVQHDKNTIVRVLNQEAFNNDKPNLKQFELNMISMYWFAKEFLILVCIQPQMYEKGDWYICKPSK